MKFHKVLKMLKDNPDLVFRSEEADIEQQDLNSIEHWICCDDNVQLRLKNFRTMFRATDWEVDPQ